MTTRILLLVIAAASLWPTWAWLARRAADGDGAAWGLVPASVLVASLFTSRASRRGPWLPVAAALLVVYGVVGAVLPPLPRAFLGLGALLLLSTGVLGSRRPTVVELGLLALSLPLMPSAQFFLGYPLRLACAELARALLWLQGTDVTREGVALVYGPWRVVVDGPCSGVRMLWVAALLVLVLASSLRLTSRALACLSAAALGLVIAGNALRATSLFLLELAPLDDGRSLALAHEGIGAATFALVASALLGLALRLPRGSDEPSPELRSGNAGGSTVVLVAAVISVTASAMSSQPRTFTSEASGGALSPGLPGTWTPAPPTDDDARFRALLPGRVSRFTSGERTLLVREVTSATRALHPSADCLRASGWSLGHRALRSGDDGVLWACFEGTKGERSSSFCERIVDAGGRSWTDVSAWYWEAALGRAEGPYRALTLSE